MAIILVGYGAYAKSINALALAAIFSLINSAMGRVIEWLKDGETKKTQELIKENLPPQAEPIVVDGLAGPETRASLREIVVVPPSVPKK